MLFKMWVYVFPSAYPILHYKSYQNIHSIKEETQVNFFDIKFRGWNNCA